MKTVSLLQPEASQARTSCGELYAKKRKTGEGVDVLNVIHARTERVQIQTEQREGQSLCFIWSEQDTRIIAALQE